MRSRTEDIRLSDLLPSLSSDRTGRRGRLKRSAGTKARAKPPFPRLESHSTRFFREPEAFEALRKVVLPRITHDCAAQQAVRIWVPECSTGEEVYSIAMVLKEYLSEAATHVKTKIFGTDANDANVATARAAIYPLASVGDLSPTRVDRFFTKVEGGYRVAPDIREMCIFSCLDLINDLPFSHLDLISCRNRLPHLRPAWQKKILRDFHFALKPTGCLLLGNSESSHIDNTWHRLTDCAAQIYSKIKGEAYFRMSAQEVRKLWGRLLTTADDEDKKIARDLHDFFVPRLFGVEQRLKEAEEQLPWHPIHARKLREIRKEISEVAKAISTLSHTLHPAVVTQFGLVPALEAECAAFTRLYKIPVKLFGMRFRNCSRRTPLFASTGWSKKHFKTCANMPTPP